MAHHLIDGVRIEIVDVEPTKDVRFFPQSWLLKMATNEARDELLRRADIAAGKLPKDHV